jgi:AraC-like DNA-binding protein
VSRRYCELTPPPDLARWVRCLWTSSPVGPAAPGWVVPDGCVDLLLLDGTVMVAGPDDGPELRRAGPREGVVVGVRFRPGRVGPLLREAPAALRNQRVALDDLGPPALAGLTERLAAAPDARSALGLLVDEVRRRAGDAADPDGLATAAADLVLAAGGDVSMGALAGELSVSERHLRRRATDELGYGPKVFARIVRFQRALGLLDGGDRPLADVAATTGYADQAHLTREVTALAGRSPGDIRRTGP